MFYCDGYTETHQHGRPQYIPQGEGQLHRAAYEEGSTQYYKKYAGAYANAPDGAFFSRRIVWARRLFNAQQLICGYSEQGGDKGQGAYIRTGYVVFPFAYRLRGYTELFRKLFLGHARSFSKGHYSLAHGIVFGCHFSKTPFDFMERLSHGGLRLRHNLFVWMGICGLNRRLKKLSTAG